MGGALPRAEPGGYCRPVFLRAFTRCSREAPAAYTGTARGARPARSPVFCPASGRRGMASGRRGRARGKGAVSIGDGSLFYGQNVICFTKNTNSKYFKRKAGTGHMQCGPGHGLVLRGRGYGVRRGLGAGRKSGGEHGGGWNTGAAWPPQMRRRAGTRGAVPPAARGYRGCRVKGGRVTAQSGPGSAACEARHVKRGLRSAACEARLA